MQCDLKRKGKRRGVTKENGIKKTLKEEMKENGEK